MKRKQDRDMNIIESYQQERTHAKRYVDRWVSFARRRCGTIFIAALLLSALSFGLASRIHLDTNMMALIPDDSPSLVGLKSVLRKTEGLGDLMVMIESPNPDSSFDYARKLIPQLRMLSWVGQVEMGQDVSFFNENQMLYMEIEDLEKILSRVERRVAYEKLRSNPFYLNLDEEKEPDLDFKDIRSKYKDRSNYIGKNYYTSSDQRILIVVIRPNGVTSDLGFARKIYAETSAIVSGLNPKAFHPKMKVSVGGTYKNRLDEYDTIMRDVRSSAIVVIVGILLLTMFYFKHPASIPIVFIPLLASISLTFGLTYLAIGRLNLITVFLLVILFGLGIDVGIHMYARYRRERARGSDMHQALVLTLRHSGRASIISSLTTAAAFFVLVVAKFRGFSEFGFIAGVGTILSAASYLLLFPAVVHIGERFIRSNETWRLKRNSAPGSSSIKNAIVLGVCFLFTLGAFISTKDLAYEYDLRKLRSDVKTTREFNRKMRRIFDNPRDPAVILADGPHEAELISEEIRKRIARAGEKGAIQGVLSLQDLIPKNQKKKLYIVKKLKHLLDEHEASIVKTGQHSIAELHEKLNVSAITLDNIPNCFKRPFIGLPGTTGELVFVYQKRSLLDLRNALEFENALKNIVINGKIYQAASEPLLYASMFRSIKQEASLIFALTIFAVISILLLTFKRMRRVAIVLTPLCIGGLWMFGLLAAFGAKINMLNVVVLPCILGLGVDGGVHIYHRFRESGARLLMDDYVQILSSVVVSLTTSMIGFGGMLSARHPGLRSIAILALVGLGANIISSVVLFPALLRVLCTRMPNRRLRRI